MSFYNCRKCSRVSSRYLSSDGALRPQGSRCHCRAPHVDFRVMKCRYPSVLHCTMSLIWSKGRQYPTNSTEEFLCCLFDKSDDEACVASRSSSEGMISVHLLVI